MIDGRYFEILQLSGFVISLQSKNTKHYWHICIEELGKIRHLKSAWHIQRKAVG